jgi:hypothetical protein
MPVTVDKLSDEPIVVVKMMNPIDIKHDVPAMSQQIQDVLARQTEPIWYIGYVQDLKLSFGDFVQALAMSTRGEMAFMRHPNIKEIYAIAEGSLVQMAARALTQAQYGGLRVTLCSSLDEALRKAREAIHASKQPA